MSHRKFWITDNTDNSGFTVSVRYDHKAMYGACNVIEVIETAALIDCQKKLEEACELLREENRLSTGLAYDGNSRVIDLCIKIDTFLSQIKEES